MYQTIAMHETHIICSHTGRVRMETNWQTLDFNKGLSKVALNVSLHVKLSHSECEDGDKTFKQILINP